MKALSSPKNDRIILLVLGASYYQLDAIQAAKRLGFRVVTTDNRPDNPGHRLADACYRVDTMDPEGVLRIARAEGIRGVLAPATDVAQFALAHVAAAMNLPGPTPECVAAWCDKTAFRQFMKSAGLPTPDFLLLGRDQEPPASFWAGGAAILKPDRSSGSKGVFIVRQADDFHRFFPNTLSYSPSSRAIMERYLEGFQGTVDGIFRDGRIVHAFFLDRQTWTPPYVTTCGHHLPTRLEAQMQRRLLELIQTISARFGYADGPFDCDFVISHDTPYILEMAPRTGGNSISRLLRYAVGLDLPAYSVHQACSIPFPLSDELPITPSAVVLLGVAQAGLLAYDADEAERLRRESWVKVLEIGTPVGAPVEAFINGRHRIGEAILLASGRAELDARVAEFKQRLDLRALDSPQAPVPAARHP